MRLRETKAGRFYDKPSVRFDIVAVAMNSNWLTGGTNGANGGTGWLFGILTSTMALRPSYGN
ncbi:hypothetical protein CCHR01_02230 [Colletotrichum chrysophilum]|uniref:Uncharacterized protein n=1 Tax=Colletotrichum chrysophilum TaxID=1836956 RepID=A0AAD9ENH5_9PEZI|nr:hypothetical protein CCHR01_02230 [Colletotrichum chrysophilum]